MHVKSVTPYFGILFGCRTYCLELPMMDVVMLAITFVFFVLSIGYVYACDRL